MEKEGPYREVRPWGEFIQFTKNEPSTVKIITVHAGESFSLQYHQHRAEFWYIISGNGELQLGEEIIPIVPGEHHLIPETHLHRVTAGTLPVIFLEISTGVFDEGDISRVEDRYGRV